ncbi:MAG: tetratricopeptide repeat protein [Phycisphaerales bacterium]|nr:tetratricopeptide repeat protein [Phycisphaerales bacterium]
MSPLPAQGGCLTMMNLTRNLILTLLTANLWLMSCDRNRAEVNASEEVIQLEEQMLAEATAKSDEGDYKQALDLFHRILEDNPTSGEAYLGIGDIYLEQQDYQRAEPALGRAAKLEPRNYKAQFQHGLALQMLDRFLDAIQAYHRALTIDPDSVEANRNLAVSYLRLEEPKNALPFAERATQLAAESGPPWVTLGAAYEGIENWKLATDAYVAASERMEPTPELMRNMLRMLVKQKRYREVISTSQTLQRFGPDADAWERAGWAWFRLGDYDKSLNAYREACKVQPEFWQAWNGVGVNRLNAWLLSEQQNQEAFAESGSAFRESLRVNGDQPKVLELMLKYRL